MKIPINYCSRINNPELQTSTDRYLPAAVTGMGQRMRRLSAFAILVDQSPRMVVGFIYGRLSLITQKKRLDTRTKIVLSSFYLLSKRIANFEIKVRRINVLLTFQNFSQCKQRRIFHPSITIPNIALVHKRPCSTCQRAHCTIH